MALGRAKTLPAGVGGVGGRIWHPYIGHRERIGVVNEAYVGVHESVSGKCVWEVWIPSWGTGKNMWICPGAVWGENVGSPVGAKGSCIRSVCKVREESVALLWSV